MILTRAALVVLPLLSLFCAATVHWLGHGPGEDLLIQRKYKEAAVLLQDALAEAPLGEAALAAAKRHAGAGARAFTMRSAEAAEAAAAT